MTNAGQRTDPAPDSGGIPSALSLRSALSAVPLPPVKIDLHPARPLRIGIKPPPRNVVVGCLPPDPTFEQLEALGGRVDLHAEAHEIVGRDGGGTGVSVSGEVPRVTGFEVGLPGAVTWVVNERGEGAWVDDPVSQVLCLTRSHWGADELTRPADPQ